MGTTHCFWPGVGGGGGFEESFFLGGGGPKTKTGEKLTGTEG